MTDDFPLVTVPEPFPISLIGERYLIFDIDAVTYIRHRHHICGVLIGTIPDVPQQNVFLGIPLELMEEEARLLVEKGAAFVVDDVEAHQRGLEGLNVAKKRAFRADLERQGAMVAKEVERKAAQRSQNALERLRLERDENGSVRSRASSESATKPEVHVDEVHAETLFDGEPSPPPPPSSSPGLSVKSNHYQRAITPTTSFPPLPAPRPDPTRGLPAVPKSYPLFAHLHEKGYYVSPGLRFGCQYLVYPGDPLRFHSHFLAVGAEWDEELDLLALVAAGRLGTGVKKGFLIGGASGGNGASGEEGAGSTEGAVRAFSIEWGGM
ncbi:MAG: tRNA-splicing endonuclease subunit [Piccolia ochrophora]|nr:MAG: tRNA-splicing endonuclease subunit [Piccolia ochrophora]